MYLAKVIKGRRKELGISQNRLAVLLNLESGQLISNIERGKCGFPRRRLKRLCRALLLDKQTIYGALILEESDKILKDLGAK